MEAEILTPEVISSLKAIGLPAMLVILGFIYRKPITKLINSLANWFLHLTNGGDSHEERIAKIESNDIKHIEADIREIKTTQKSIKETQNLHSNRLAVLETKLEK